jgi:hypothetical protein
VVGDGGRGGGSSIFPIMSSSDARWEVNGGYLNVHDLRQEERCEKVDAVLGWFERGAFDFLFLSEMWHYQGDRLRSSPSYVASSTPQEGGEHQGGVVLLAAAAMKEKITELMRGVDWITFEAGGHRVGGAYLRPPASLNTEQCRRMLGEIDGGKRLTAFLVDVNASTPCHQTQDCKLGTEVLWLSVLGPRNGIVEGNTAGNSLR